MVLIGAGCAWAQLLPPPPPDPNPPKYAEPPEEDESLATPKVYSFNPLQAKKEISTGDFYMKRGNFKGAAYQAATELVFKGMAQPSGYTEPLLHAWRLKVKAA